MWRSTYVILINFSFSSSFFFFFLLLSSSSSSSCFCPHFFKNFLPSLIPVLRGANLFAVGVIAKKNCGGFSNGGGLEEKKGEEGEGGEEVVRKEGWRGDKVAVYVDQYKVYLKGATDFDVGLKGFFFFSFFLSLFLFFYIFLYPKGLFLLAMVNKSTRME